MSSLQEDELPSKAAEIARDFPEVWGAYANLGKACATAGPITGKELRLIKLALAIGASSEGAVHSHARRAIAASISKEEIRQVALLAIPTLGFPHAVRVLSWIEDVTNS